MCVPAYIPFEYNSPFVSESSPLEEYGRLSGRVEWTDDEIESIRTVLQKLTALRIVDVMDAEDLVQDTFLTMILKCPANELEKGLLVWSMGILRKKVGNYYRKSQRCAWLKEQESYAQQWIRQSKQSSPEKKMVQEELRGIVERTLEQLPPAQRTAMELLVAGFNAGEIAEKLHPERYQNVMNHLYRGRKKMAKELAKYGYGPNSRLKMAKGRRRR